MMAGTVVSVGHRMLSSSTFNHALVTRQRKSSLPSVTNHVPTGAHVSRFGLATSTNAGETPVVARQATGCAGPDYIWRGPPPTWEDVTDFITSGDLAKFGRFSQVQSDYLVHKAKVELTYRRMDDFIRHIVFGCPPKKDEGGRLVAEFTPEMQRECIIVLRPNDFPYALPHGAHHTVLWSNRQLTEAEVQSQIRGLLPNHADTDVAYFINPLVRRSVPDVFHAHLIVKPKTPAAL
eukprot:comp19599_c0_seq1/m.23074 comp19599_c0_seq1/g.23074  ORF comp19599_c0_seq1/g.23074 comp19599_c0_seq1/m.23074 type:complete len:235 (-) comp19599_c0_seq1:169-873(-)